MQYSALLALGLVATSIADNAITIPVAPPAGLITLGQNPKPDNLNSPIRARLAAAAKHKPPESNTKRAQGPVLQSINTLYSGVYPTVQMTWANKVGNGQTFTIIVDTGSCDIFVAGDQLQCVDLKTRQNRPRDVCGFGTLYDTKAGSWDPIKDEFWDITYAPNMENLKGTVGWAPMSLGSLTLDRQQAALVYEAAWKGDGISSGLLGLGFPAGTAFVNATTTKHPAWYSPLFYSLLDAKKVPVGVYTVALNRVKQDTKPTDPAGLLALGGLVPDTYFEPPLVSVDIVKEEKQTEYTRLHVEAKLVYGASNSKTRTPTPTFRTDLDIGSAANFIPTVFAEELNALFDPPALFKKDLGYYAVGCDATPPYAAWVFGNVEMAMDPRDMIVRGLPGVKAYETDCFSAFAQGGEMQDRGSFFVTGATWMRGHIVVYDMTNKQLQFAARKPY